MEDQKRKRNTLPRLSGKRVIALVILLAVCVGLIFGYVRSGSVSGEEETVDGAFRYEAGSDQTFAVVGDGLAVASSTGIALFDGNGASVVQKIYSMSQPAIVSAGGRAAFFDVGGTSLRVADLEGNYTVLDTEESIISVTANEHGWLAVCTEEAGYKGQVTIYNSDWEPVYRWHSGEGYLLKAEIRPDSRGFAVLSLASDGGKVQLFSLQEDEPVGVYEAAETLLFDLHWCNGSRLCVLSENGAYFIADDGEEISRYDFQGSTLVDYNMNGSGFVALCLSKYRAGGEARLVTLDEGGEIATLETQRDLVGMDCSGKQILLQFSDGLALTDRGLELREQDVSVLGVKRALLRPRGDVFLLSAYSAELYQ